MSFLLRMGRRVMTVYNAIINWNETIRVWENWDTNWEDNTPYP
jgi:hypothetical protein